MKRLTLNSMTGKIAIAAALAIGVVTLGGLAGGAAGAAPGRTDGDASPGPLACTIDQSRSGGQIILEPSVRAARATDGSYSLRVNGSGGNTSSIRQGGDFQLAAGETARLGNISLSGSAAYAVTLDITSGAASTRCIANIGG